MRYRPTTLAITAALIASGQPLAAQGAIAGVIVDERGAPVAGAEIRDTTGLRTVSSSSGRFSAANAGRVRVRRLGFAPLDTVLGEGVGHRLQLRPSTTVLARLIVHPGFSGSGPSVQAPTVTMSRRELEALPQPGDDLFRALARLPGIAANEVSARLRVRGGAADELLYQFDGVELPDPYHLPDLDAALSMVDLRMVGGVDLHAGTLPLELGQRTAGAIVFPLPAFDGAANATSASISVTGLRLSQHLRLGSRADADVIARRGYLELALDAMGESDGLTPRYGDTYARVRWYGARDRLSAHLLSGDDYLRYARVGDPRSTARYNTTVGWVTTEHERASWNVTSTLSVTRRASTRDVQDEPGTSTPSRFRDARRTVAVGARVDLRRPIGARHVLRVGGEWRPATSHFDLLRLRDTAAVVRNVVRRGTDTTQLLGALDTQRSGSWLGVRSQLPWRITQELGARLDVTSWTGQSLVAPRAAWLVPLRGATTLRVGVGVTTQAQLPEERALADGDTTMYPATRALQQAVGVSGIANGIRWRTDVYWRTTRHERPQWVNARNGAIIAPELLDDRIRLHASRGDASGIELSLRDDGGSPWTWSTSWTIARSRVDVNGRWIARPWDRRQTGTLDIGRTIGAWQFAGGWVYHSGDPTSSSVVLRTPSTTGVLSQTVYPRPFDRRLPEYHRLDLRVVRSWQRGHTTGRVYLDLLNAYGRRNVRRMTTNTTRNANGQEIETVRRETGLPLLPSIGVSLDWR